LARNDLLLTINSKKLTRRDLLPYFQALPLCLIGIEACATAHNWTRQLQALGHDVRLIPPSYVKLFCVAAQRMTPLTQRQFVKR
jgi:transposase